MLVALVNGEVVTNLRPLTGFWGLNVFLPIALIAVVTLGLHFLLGGKGWREHKKGLWPLIVGMDGRLSTSKVQLTLWTFAIVLALLLLLFFGKDFSALELQPEYLLLLGSPAAAALLAKTFTSTKVSNGTVEKTEAEEPSVRDVVTDDKGNTDLFDFQYFLFNLVLLLWFAVQMRRTLSDPSQLANEAYFLPPLPLPLVGLTSASAAGYVVKKGLETARPVLLAAYPSVAAPHSDVRLTGQNLRIEGEAPAAGVVRERVTFGGRNAEVAEAPRTNPQGFDEIDVRVPADAQPGQAAVQFTRADGAVSDSLGFEVEASVPNVLSVNPDRIVLTDGTSPDRRQRITILGSSFGDYDTNNPPSNRVSLGSVPLEVPEDGWATERIWALAPTLADCKKVGLDVPGRTELVVIDRYGRRSAPTVVEFVEGDNSDISRENTEQALEPGWDETNVSTAFKSGNLRGRSIPGQLRQALGSMSPKIEEAAAVGNSNYQMKVPVVHLPGRGLDLALDLTYNSRLWHRDRHLMNFDIDRGWPAPGWSLGFGKLAVWARVDSTVPPRVERPSSIEEGMLVDADSTRHPYSYVDTVRDGSTSHKLFQTNDGKLIDYSIPLIGGVIYPSRGSLSTQTGPS